TPPPASVTEEPQRIAGWAFVDALRAPLRKTIPGQPIAILHAGQRLDILAATEDRAWLFVRWRPEADTPPQTGWVRAEDVRYFVDPQDIPILCPGGCTASANATPAPTSNQGQVTARKLNLRAGPGMDQAILTQLRRGDQVQVMGRSDNGQWLNVTSEAGFTGWVAARWIAFPGNVEELPVLRRASTAAAILPTPQGLILFQDRPGGTIYAIRADGTGLRRLSTGLDPALSPGADQAAFTRWSSEGDGVYILDLATGRERMIWRDNKPRSPAWSPDAQALVFDHITGDVLCRDAPVGCISDDQLRAIFHGHECGFLPLLGHVCIDDLPQKHRQILGLRTLTLATRDVHDPLSSHARAPRHHPQQPWLIALSDAGVIRVNESGDPPSLLIHHGFLGAPVFSPDGRFIYVSRKDGDSWNIWRYNSDGAGEVALTQPPRLRDRPVSHVAPAVSPDGRFILFLTDRRGKWELWIMHSDGSHQRPFAPQALADIAFDFDFSPARMLDWQ
ncbi:MAG TPA: SH3 domain-containing protein, partial [Caldilineae bacterium]|nr:SH3 domain-containing protein [Caldilineae bacterium]